MTKTIERKSRHDLALIQEAGQIVADTLVKLMKVVEPGMSTLDLDRIAEENIRKAGALPTFKGYYGFPATLCTSVNEEVVHGIPRADKILKEGDVVSIDCGATYKGLVGDSAVTIGVGKISDDLRKLLDATDECLHAGIAKMVSGNFLEDISGALEDVAMNYGYGIVRQYGGHGVGRKLHEEPFLHNFRTGNRGPELKSGVVLAIEPMLNMGGDDVFTAEDNWTVITTDGLPSAHFEHTVIVTEDGPLIATARHP
jgi:methionyl aminopeptidase